MPHDREFDLVLLGATGFTGGLTAEYLARHAPEDLRWAIAGRNLARVDIVRRDLAARIDERFETLPMIEADSFDYESLAAMALRSKVVISTVGPYINYGENLVKACAQTGTDYADLTGEPEFVDTMYLRYHDVAVHHGARLVHCCGFDSVPHDLGVLFTVGQLPEGAPISIDGVVHSNGTFSAGTFHSAITGFSRAKQTLSAAKARKAKEIRPTDRRARSVSGRIHKVAQGWIVPLPTIDPMVVARSARALARYGPDFTYSHYARFTHLPTALGAGAGVGAAIGLAQIKPVKEAMLRRFNPGSGPSQSRRAKSTFDVTFTGRGGAKTVRTRVSGGDPGYDETAKMLAESGLCLALDPLPVLAGQLTPAVAMGQHLIDRLVQADMRFEVLSS